VACACEPSRVRYLFVRSDSSAFLRPTEPERSSLCQEWRCLTGPTNALSALRLLTPSLAVSNVAVRRQSMAGVSYFLERSTDLSATPPFTLLATGRIGEACTTTYTDPNATPAPHLFYCVGLGQ